MISRLWYYPNFPVMLQNECCTANFTIPCTPHGNWIERVSDAKKHPANIKLFTIAKQVKIIFCCTLLRKNCSIRSHFHPINPVSIATTDYSSSCGTGTALYNVCGVEFISIIPLPLSDITVFLLTCALSPWWLKQCAQPIPMLSGGLEEQDIVVLSFSEK